MQLISKNLIRNVFWIGVFGLAMGFLEAIVVVYLRDIYYPHGFGFPLSPVSPQMYYAELVREFSTLLMLIALACLVGRTDVQKLACFLISFAIWDIFYYIALKLFLNWPRSLLTWDVLFLIPLPWLGPVIAPVLVSLTMIWVGGWLLLFQDWKPQITLKTGEILFLILGSVLIFLSFIWNYSTLIVNSGFLSNFWTLAHNKDFLNMIYEYAPKKFNWFLFTVGELAIFATTVNILIRYQQFFHQKTNEFQHFFNDVRKQIFKTYIH